MKTEREIRDEIKAVNERIDELYERFKFYGLDEESFKLERARLMSAKDTLEWIVREEK